MTIGDGVDFSTTLINKTTISKSSFRVFGNPYEFVFAKPTVEGLTPLEKQCVWLPRIGFWTFWFLNMTSSGKFEFWFSLLKNFPTELWLITSIFGVSTHERGGLQIFRKNKKLFFSLKSPEKNVTLRERKPTILIHLWINGPLMQPVRCQYSRWNNQTPCNFP